LDRVRAARRYLHELGVGAGDVVALKLRNRVEFVVLLFACWRLGATVTPVNPSLTDAEVMRQLEASGARLLVVEDGAGAPGAVTTLAVGNLYAKGPGWDGPRPGHTINHQALHALCAAKLAGYKRPTTITITDSIPKNAVGKTDKAPLRAAHLKGTSV
jgi:acyl-CoA synthetase (AMP-forming)/AMP-acid ligase II